MDRRGFLQAILAAGVAPAFVGSAILMSLPKRIYTIRRPGWTIERNWIEQVDHSPYFFDGRIWLPGDGAMWTITAPALPYSKQRPRLTNYASAPIAISHFEETNHWAGEWSA